eukprot:COSAG01_NODE_8781_length_2661_cov_2.509758_3_plen_129_part_00
MLTRRLVRTLCTMRQCTNLCVQCWTVLKLKSNAVKLIALRRRQLGSHLQATTGTVTPAAQLRQWHSALRQRLIVGVSSGALARIEAVGPDADTLTVRMLSSSFDGDVSTAFPRIEHRPCCHAAIWHSH